MTIEKTVEPYEVLFRFRKDENGEAIVAGHKQSLQKIVMDGEVIKEDILPAQELDLAALPALTIMTEMQAQAINQATRLFAENNALKLQLAQLEAKLRADWSADVAVQKETIRSFANDARRKNQIIETQESTIRDLQTAISGSKVLPTDGSDSAL